MAEKDYSQEIASVVMDWLQAGNTVKVYTDEPVPDRRKGAESHGYDFSKVDPKRVYSLKEAADCIGMTYEEAWRAQKVGIIRTVRSTWNNRRILVMGSELKRLLKEEFVECKAEEGTADEA